MWQAITDEIAQPGFWPPRPSRFWTGALEPLRRLYLERIYRVARIEVRGIERLAERVQPGDGLLLAPNHSHDSDPHVMLEVARRSKKALDPKARWHFMAAWQIFKTHGGLDGWILQRLGAFSVDREGCDRRAIRQAIEVLTSGNALVVFPEGEVYHLNERLRPLLEGVAFMALAAQRDLDRASTAGAAPSRRVWVVPAAIRYRFLEDCSAALEEAFAALARRIPWNPPSGAPLHERILRFGEILLTIKEKEKLGRSLEGEGNLPARIARLTGELLARLEAEHLGKSSSTPPSTGNVPLRIKAVRRRLLEIWTREGAGDEERRRARAGLDDIQLALQLFSYPGDYLAERPTPERMAETIEKFEEDLLGRAQTRGRREARVTLGEPMDLKEFAAAGKQRGDAGILTERLEEGIRGVMG